MWKKVRMKATQQVIELAPYVAAQFIRDGLAEEIGAQAAAAPIREGAMLQPAQEQAAFTGIKFHVGPRG